MSKEISVLVIGCGNMGASHATAYHNHKGFKICGLVSRGDISNDEINRRINKAELELDYASKFDKIIINNDLEESKKIASNLVNEFIENE